MLVVAVLVVAVLVVAVTMRVAAVLVAAVRIAGSRLGQLLGLLFVAQLVPGRNALGTAETDRLAIPRRRHRLINVATHQRANRVGNPQADRCAKRLDLTRTFRLGRVTATHEQSQNSDLTNCKTLHLDLLGRKLD